MTDTIPSFIATFSETKQSEPPEVVKPPKSQGEFFTIRDHEVAQAILNHAKWAHQMTDIEVSNATLGKALGMTNGAISARIKRLARFGIVTLTYFNATDTGKNNRRLIHVVKQPPAPFSPWVPRGNSK